MVTQTRLPAETEQLLGRELSSGEVLLWAGQPDPGHMARQAKNVLLFLFGIPWTIGVLFLEYQFIRMALGLPMFRTSPVNVQIPQAPFDPMALVFPIFGLLFLLPSLWLLSSPYRAKRAALKTAYAVTDRRALILEPDWRGRVVIRSVTPENLADRTRTENRDGSGSMIFNRLTTRQSGGEGGSIIVTVGFDHIADVKAVDDLIGQRFPMAG